MRILFVSTHVNPLASPRDGDAQRTRLLLQACTQIADVDLVTFAGPAEATMQRVRVVYDKYSRPTTARYNRVSKWTSVLPFTGLDAMFPVSKSVESKLDDILISEDYDFIVSRYFSRTYSCGLWKYRKKLIIDFDDSIQSFFLNQIQPTSTTSFRLRMYLASKKVQCLSRKIVNGVHTAFFSDAQQARANKAIHLPNVPYYTESCGLQQFSDKNRRILFVGQLDYIPNREGVEHFLKEVYLPLSKRLPDMEMHIVGSLHDEEVRKRWQEDFPRVTVTGFVDDLQSEYEQAHVVVVPIYKCGGTNIKLLEAMNMNRACVTTKNVVEKMGWKSGNKECFFAAENDREFEQYVEKLLTDCDLNVKIAGQGRAFMAKYYSSDAFCQIFTDNVK